MLDSLGSLAPMFRELVPLLIVVVIASLALGGTHAVLRMRERRVGAAFPFSHPLAMIAVTALALVAAVVALPVGDSTRGQLLSLFGLGVTGLVAFSSSTFVANAMAGMMLRAVGNFRAGDWVRIGEQFGRVTERGLFHTELQTEDRDLATLPNLYLVTNPVVVVRESGTIVSVRLSLGYDHHHAELESLFVDAARTAGLADPFVQILELGDFSVTYRVAGFLSEVKHLLTARSHLRGVVLDTLHGAGVEIVSPNFMNQRQVGAEAPVIPGAHLAAPHAIEATAPEDVIFDKAERRASIEEMRVERTRLLEEIEALEKTAKAGSQEEKEAAEAEIERRRARIDEIAAALERENQEPSE